MTKIPPGACQAPDHTTGSTEKTKQRKGHKAETSETLTARPLTNSRKRKIKGKLLREAADSTTTEHLA